MKESWIARICLVAAAILLCLGSAAWALTPQEELGQLLYFDEFLSKNKNQSCASCHFPEPGFVDPDNVANPDYWVVSLGSYPNLNGGRNSPSVAYAAFSPAFYWNEGAGLYMGGQFWDGRAATLTEQAKGPFLNPLEMAMKDESAVLAAIAAKKNPNSRTYRKLFLQVYGVDLLTLDLGDRNRIVAVYEMVTEAIAAFEKTAYFRPFTSKYDYHLAGKATLSAQEMRGLALFNGKAQCHLCHPAELTEDAAGNSMPPLFTDYSYDNLGIPKSKNFLIAGNPIDYGIGGRPDIAAVDPDPELSAAAGYPVSAGEAGKFKVMTLRNIAVTPPYGHNGFFATLEQIVHFYNKRDMMQGMGGGGDMGGGGMGGGGGGMKMAMQPEVAQNMNTEELGNLGLTMMEERDLVAFLKTLTDGYGKFFPYNFPPPSL
jgi:cytochrome c peroxidase